MSYMDKDSTKLERWLIIGYTSVLALSIWQDAIILAAFSAFCLGMSIAAFAVIKGWTRYYKPALSPADRSTT